MQNPKIKKVFLEQKIFKNRDKMKNNKMNIFIYMC